MMTNMAMEYRDLSKHNVEGNSVESGQAPANLDVAQVACDIQDRSYDWSQVDAYSPLEQRAVIDELIKQKAWHPLFHRFELFTKVPLEAHEAILDKVIASGDGGNFVPHFFEKFTGVSPSKHVSVVCALIEQGTIFKLFDDWEKFFGLSSDNYIQIAHKFLTVDSRENMVSFINNFDKFSQVTGAIHKDIAIKAIQVGGGDRVCINLQLFTAIDETDHDDLLNALLACRDGRTISCYLPVLTGIDKNRHEEVAWQVIRAGNGMDFLHHQKNFSGISPEIHVDLLLAIIDRGHTDNVYRYLSNFHIPKERYIDIYSAILDGGGSAGTFLRHVGREGISEEDIEEILRHLAMKGNMRSFVDILRVQGNFTQEKKEAILDKTGQEELVRVLQRPIIKERRRYEFLRKALAWLPVGERRNLNIFTQKEGLAEVQALVDDGQKYLAGELLRCLHDMCGLVEDSAQADILAFHKSEQEKRNHKGENSREAYEQVDIQEELISFYGRNLLEMEVEDAIFKQDKRKADTQEFATLQDNVRYHELLADYQKEVERIFAWMRQYLVQIVYDELKYIKSREVLDEVFLPKGFRSIDEFITGATPQEIVEYADDAAKSFTSDVSPLAQAVGVTPFKGKKWAVIALHAKKMWQEGLSLAHKKVLVDQVFQLQHNTNSVFDKDDSKVSQIHLDNIQSLLDVKFAAKDFNDFYKNIKDIVKDDSEAMFLLRFIKRWQVDPLLSAPRRDRGTA